MGEFYVYVFMNGALPSSGDEEWQLEHKVPFQPFYVGKGTDRRIYEHFAPSNLTRETPFYRKLRKLIREDHFDDTQHIIKLYEGLTEEDAWKKEEELISFWGRKTKKNEGWGMLYNVADGGLGGNTLTEANRAQARDSHRRRMQLVVNDTYRQKCSQSHKKLWAKRDPSLNEAHRASIRKQAQKRSQTSLAATINKEIEKIVYHTPFGGFSSREEARAYIENKMQIKIPASTWRLWYYKFNNQIIAPTISTGYEGNSQRRKRSKAWENYSFLHSFEGKTFYEAGFYIEVICEDNSSECLHGESILNAGRSLH